MQLFLENTGGCSDSATYTVCVNPEMKIHVPNSFSPNNDNCNDEFYVKGAGLLCF